METRHVPDGGYGWVVATASLFITCLSYGIFYSIGTIFDVLVGDLNCGDSQLALCASTAYSLQSVLGLFISPLLRHFSYRQLCIFGVFLCSISIGSSAFAPNSSVLLFTFGVVGGIGAAFIYLPINIIIPFYFSKRQGLAFGIALVGGYIGSFLFPYFISFLVSVYNWRGALFVLAGVQLNSLIGALFLLPNDEEESSLQKGPSRTSLRSDYKDEEPSDSCKDLAQFIENNITGCKTDSPSIGGSWQELQADESGESKKLNNLLHPLIFKKRSSRDSLRRQALSVDTSRHNLAVHPSQITPHHFMKYQPSPLVSDIDHIMNEDFLNGKYLFQKNRAISEAPVGSHWRYHNSTHNLKRTLSKISQDSNLSGLSNLYGSVLTVMAGQHGHHPRFMTSGLVSRQLSETIEENKTESVSADTDTSSKEVQPIESKPKGSRLVTWLRPYKFMLTDVLVLLFWLATVLKGVVFYVPSLFIVNYGVSIGMSTKQTTMLMSTYAMGHVVGRPLMAFISDYFLGNCRSLFSAAVLATMAIVLVLAVLVVNFYVLAFAIFLYGYTVGFFQCQMAPILSEMLDALDKVVIALPFFLAAEGVGYLIGPPLLALLPNYELIFIVTGFLVLTISAVMVVIAIAECVIKSKVSADD